MIREDSWARAARLWDAYFAVAYAVVVALLVIDQGATSPRLITSLVALTAMAALYALWGRRLIPADAIGPLRLFVGLQLGLLVVAVAADPGATNINFALSPLMFLCLPLRQAIAAAVVANVLPLLITAAGAGTGRSLSHSASMAALGIALSVLLGVWVVRVLQQSRERLELIEELEASRAEVARLSRESGVAAERARLAGEIHDTLAQGFTSIITLVQAAGSELDRDPVRAREHLGLAVRTARDNLAESRALIGALAPAALDTGSLDQAVRRQAERLGEETGATVRYAVSGEPIALATAVEVVVLRAAQEALANVRRHAGATAVEVGLTYADSCVVMRVRDDGRGFDPQPQVHGFGLAGMRARAGQVNGVLTVESELGRGTTVTLEVPT